MCIVITLLGLFYFATFLLDLGAAADGMFPFIWTPKYMYNNTRMNWFGVYLVTIFAFLIEPIGSIIRFIYWLCHVGRNY